ncbi:MAG: hypothetical protein IAE97_00235 [Chthoniobacterales bacterium]|nr:hypothetical protein [Chthoniobacterales bacterium]
MRQKTSINVDPEVWEEFKKVAKAHKRTGGAELELLMEEAIAAHGQKKGGFAPPAPLSVRPIGSTAHSGARRRR